MTHGLLYSFGHIAPHVFLILSGFVKMDNQGAFESELEFCAKCLAHEWVSSVAFLLLLPAPQPKLHNFQGLVTAAPGCPFLPVLIHPLLRMVTCFMSEEETLHTLCPLSIILF